MSAPWILLVEDEPLLGNLITDNLQHEGFETEWVQDGLAALERARKGGLDLIILDLMLPGCSGLKVLEELRGKGDNVPVLILSARVHEDDRIRGLTLGADDYLTKPFNLRELLLRVQALLRRAGSPENPSASRQTRISFGGHHVNLETYHVTTSTGEEHRLTRKEAQLLRFLVGNAGKVVSRKEILDSVWGVDSTPTTRTIDNFIARFRKLFEKDPRNPRHFHTLRGVGYRFES